MAVDAGAVGAVQVGQDDVGVVELDFGVVAADPLVVEAELVAFLAADGDGDAEVAPDAAFVDPLDHLERDRFHGHPSGWLDSREVSAAGPSTSGTHVYRRRTAKSS